MVNCPACKKQTLVIQHYATEGRRNKAKVLRTKAKCTDCGYSKGY